MLEESREIEHLIAGTGIGFGGRRQIKVGIFVAGNDRERGLGQVGDGAKVECLLQRVVRLNRGGSKVDDVDAIGIEDGDLGCSVAEEIADGDVLRRSAGLNLNWAADACVYAIAISDFAGEHNHAGCAAVGKTEGFAGISDDQIRLAVGRAQDIAQRK